MITSCQLLDIIEAAHISLYRGGADNHLQIQSAGEDLAWLLGQVIEARIVI